MNLRLATSYAPPKHWPHGTPYRIGDDPDHDIALPHEIEQAASLVAQEASTLDEKESVSLRTQLDELCYRIQCRCFGDSESTLVWYHPDTRDFWAYPGAPL